MPGYSFNGSSLTELKKLKERSICQVISKTFGRIVTDVKSHERRGGSVAMRKTYKYGAHNHISRALKQTNALKATDLGKNRIVLITSLSSNGRRKYKQAVKYLYKRRSR
jgi:hypothetical protein